ncbi:hypothetical protein SGRIM128S_09393 [Streptomyces griseomycini]
MAAKRFHDLRGRYEVPFARRVDQGAQLGGRLLPERFLHQLSKDVLGEVGQHLAGDVR